MKLGALLLAIASAGCFQRASDQFACTTNDQCDSDRVCERSFCVVGARPNDGPDALCKMWTPTPEHFDPCMIPQPPDVMPLVLDQGDYTYDTNTNTLTGPGSPGTPATATVASGRLISVSKFEIATGSTLRVTGDSALIVASWGDISIAGTLEVGSDATTTGPGANPSDCAARAGGNGVDNNGNGGSAGGGGGFQGAGGAGGTGHNTPVVGTAGQTIAVPLLSGGCPGGKGGNGTALGGAGGAGGGAIQLTAQNAVAIDGTINAGGAGGLFGAGDNNNQNGGGGGGAGSGGMIGVEAATISVAASAILAANGGGGGQGGRGNPGDPGDSGTATATPTPGGILGGGAGGGPGGDGTGGLMLTGQAGQPDPGDGGGGGGGGGCGFIAFKTAVPSVGPATISPTFVTR